MRLQFNLADPFIFVNDPNTVMTDMDYPLYPEGIYLALKVTSV